MTQDEMDTSISRFDRDEDAAYALWLDEQRKAREALVPEMRAAQAAEREARRDAEYWSAARQTYEDELAAFVARTMGAEALTDEATSLYVM